MTSESDRTRPRPGGSEMVVPLLEEALVVSKRLVETAVVRVATTTVTTDRLVDEELWQTRVVVERLPIGRTIDTVPPIREEGDTTVIPVVEEVVVVERRLVLKEEIRIRRVTTATRHVETVTVREQQASIERRPATDANDPRPATDANDQAATSLLQLTTPKGR